ncbi:rhodanese-like domain-containing protein [Acetobacterium malicum]|uniref:Rhodanese-like domain-containing protein n=1 Tax=Acetobacterium malicum TaxID=52692 RepID=A0ABR6YUG4_9FIRM|nr:rhodanese-like domain-containing protein [Acetobacterium malicum]MBC3898783.1 rhodanese-like domain-containing protein [Acetobacterium malicum]
MKKLGILLLVVVILVAGCSSQEKAKEKAVLVNKITAAEAKVMIDGGEDLVILDVRTQEEYDQGHIENAVLIPDTEISAKAPTVLADQNQTILVYCRTGRRSAEAAKKLVDLGYTHIYDFGGIVDWPYEVVK